MEEIKTDKKILKNFGITMGSVFLVIAGLFLFKQQNESMIYSFTVSCVFLILGLVLPDFLKPVFIIWMRLAFILGWLNTRIILIILYYSVFSPISLFMKLFKVDLLEVENKKVSYWKIKEKDNFNLVSYERRF